MQKLKIFFIFLLFLSPTLSHAEKTVVELKKTAKQYYWGYGGEKSHTKALSLYLKAAEKGDREAKYIAGGMYYKGLGTHRDLKKAFALLYEAALLGNSTPQSQRILGQYFLIGHTIPKNYSEALKWYKMAADNGDREAQSELAFLYFTGKGGVNDSEKAFYWYEKSARQGLAVAQYSLGIMFFSGSGVENPDLIQSYGWLSLAASQNHQEAIIARDYLEKLLSNSELEKAQDYSVKLFTRIK